MDADFADEGPGIDDVEGVRIGGHGGWRSDVRVLEEDGGGKTDADGGAAAEPGANGDRGAHGVCAGGHGWVAEGKEEVEET